MTLTPAGGLPYEPAIIASLDNIAVVTADSSTATASDNTGSQSGGGALDGLLGIALSLGWLAKTLRPHLKSRPRNSPSAAK